MNRDAWELFGILTLILLMVAAVFAGILIGLGVL